jgi:hypothetical protein
VAEEGEEVGREARDFWRSLMERERTWRAEEMDL